MAQRKAGKLGAQEPTPKPTDFKLTALAVDLPPLPRRPFGHGTIYTDWKMLGNDQVGDCEQAGADHETMLYNKLVGRSVVFTTANTLSDYSAITGYNPNDPNTDQGTNTHDLHAYRRQTGMIDSKGRRHKIDGYAWLDPGDWDRTLRSIYAFGAAGLAIAVPESAMEQYMRGEPWEDVGDTNILGYHYIPGVGSQAPATELSIITWGRKQRMTRKFFMRNNIELSVPLSRETLKLSGLNERGIDWQKLSDMLASL